MSWSIDITGTKDAVLKKATMELEKIRQNYEGTQEGLDVQAVSERLTGLIGALKMDDYFNAVRVAASGSHYTLDGRVGNAKFELEVQRIALAL